MTLKWAQNRISTLNDLIKAELAFLWIIPASVPNIKQTECSGIGISLYKRHLIPLAKATHCIILLQYYRITTDAIELLNMELAKMDVSNYKTNWIGPYLKNFANEKGVPFATLMKILRSILSGVNVHIYMAYYYHYYFHYGKEIYHM